MELSRCSPTSVKSGSYLRPVPQRLGPDGRYEEVEASAFLGVRPDEVARWLVAEDTTDEIAWLERLSAWLGKEWKKPS
jgi:hypothetical protein